MNTLAIWKIASALIVLALPPLVVEEDAPGYDAVDGKNVRVTRHEDGSRTVFTRSPDDRVLTKMTYGPDKGLTLYTVYRLDPHGNTLSCKIYDGKKTELYKVSYGYRKSDGQLVEERMYDSRTGHPVRRFLYTYDAEGKRSAPYSVTLTAGKTAQEVFGAKSGGMDPAPSALEANPFREDAAKPVNPSAKPLRNR